ncbi:sulfotransferase family protein [Legionella nagasakiensis]|uniref:sulfotransferase family protein n=1 Tax=Legionella nagasakiensis TaxID=535290 RepID=UPI0013EF84FF|nr:sulfotransferase [Legionella nagasakiensis]
MEKIQHELFLIAEKVSPSCIFIIGAPRTGSTILYQALIHVYKLGYIANITNDFFFKYPTIGFALHAANVTNTQILSKNKYGKTKGIFQPSEGSFVLKEWFGGEHPSQTRSHEILNDVAAEHFTKSIKYANFAFNNPFLIKNPWNCFRIKAISRLLPNARFIWIRRNMAASAKSDLDSRYINQGDPCKWNSATPQKISELQDRPYWEQVVENQFEFNIAIQKDLNSIEKNRFVEVWYEDFCRNPVEIITKIGKECHLTETEISVNLLNNFEILRSGENYQLTRQDINYVDNYIKCNIGRFNAFVYEK